MALRRCPMCAALLGLMLVCSTRILPLTLAAPSPAMTRSADDCAASQGLRRHVAPQPRVDVAGAGNLQLLESLGQGKFGDDLLGNLARSFAQALGQLEREGQRELAHGHVGRLVDDDVGQVEVVLLAQEAADVAGKFRCCSRYMVFLRARLVARPAAEKVSTADPRRLKPPKDDKNKGLATAQLKLRPFKTYRTRLFPQPVKPSRYAGQHTIAHRFSGGWFCL